jgi:inosose dehydratase
MSRFRIGTVPILWNNADLPDLAPNVPADRVLDEIARLGFEGTQAGIGFKTGRALKAELASRSLTLAEVYAELPADASGPHASAGDSVLGALDRLNAADGDVLVVALALSPERAELAGRADAPGVPRLGDEGWRRLTDVLGEVVEAAGKAGRRAAFHPHAGTYVETPGEIDRLMAETTDLRLLLCLDTGHLIVGGGDPAGTVATYGERIGHVHLKDVAPEPLERLRSGASGGFLDALRDRLFTELGGGLLDLAGVLRALVDAGYDGWLMVEQDTTWRPAAESAAISRRILDYVLRQIGADPGPAGTETRGGASATVRRTDLDRPAGEPAHLWGPR